MRSTRISGCQILSSYPIERLASSLTLPPQSITLYHNSKSIGVESLWLLVSSSSRISTGDFTSDVHRSSISTHAFAIYAIDANVRRPRNPGITCLGNRPSSVDISLPDLCDNTHSTAYPSLDDVGSFRFARTTHKLLTSDRVGLSPTTWKSIS